MMDKCKTSEIVKVLPCPKRPPGMAETAISLLTGSVDPLGLFVFNNNREIRPGPRFGPRCEVGDDHCCSWLKCLSCRPGSFFVNNVNASKSFVAPAID